MRIGMGIDLVPGCGAFTSGGSLLDGSEADGTNLLTGGSGMTSDWSTADATLTNAAAVAPDGTTTASSLIEAASDSRHIVYQLYNATLGELRYSVYAKQITRRYIVVYVPDALGNAIKVYADLQTGTITDTEALGTAAITSANIEAAVNGFYKITVVGSMGGSESSVKYPAVALSDVSTYGAPLSSNDPQYVGDGTSGVYLWRPKLVDV